MIFAIQQVSGEDPNIQFKRLYLCSKTDIVDLLENTYIEEFLSFDNGIYTNIDDPFLFSFIYAN
jgi:hypothetical protein